MPSSGYLNNNNKNNSNLVRAFHEFYLYKKGVNFLKGHYYELYRYPRRNKA